jgi:hypothetical protein
MTTWPAGSVMLASRWAWAWLPLAPPALVLLVAATLV